MCCIVVTTKGTFVVLESWAEQWALGHIGGSMRWCTRCWAQEMLPVEVARILDAILIGPCNPTSFHLLKNDYMGMFGSLPAIIHGVQHQVLEMTELSVLVKGIGVTGQESGDKPCMNSVSHMQPYPCQAHGRCGSAATQLQPSPNQQQSAAYLTWPVLSSAPLVVHPRPQKSLCHQRCLGPGASWLQLPGERCHRAAKQRSVWLQSRPHLHLPYQLT